MRLVGAMRLRGAIAPGASRAARLGAVVLAAVVLAGCGAAASQQSARPSEPSTDLATLEQ